MSRPTPSGAPRSSWRASPPPNAPPRPDRNRSAGLLLHRVLAAPGHFVGRNVLDMCRHGPAVAERILERSRAVAIELVLHRAQLLRAGAESALERRVDIGDVDHQAHCRATVRLR